jgi:Carboxypeptidase regulatory-like domain
MRAPVTTAIALFLVALPSAAQDLTGGLTGAVRDVTGSVVPDTVVELESKGAPIGRFRTVTDGAGIYRFFGLPKGDYDLKLSRPGFNPLTVKSTVVLDGEHRTMPPVHLSAAYCGSPLPLESIRFLPSIDLVGDLGGTVKLDDSPEQTIPISSASVTLICQTGKACGEAKTDSDGVFLFRALPPGHFSVRVTKAGFYPLRESDYAVGPGLEQIYAPIYIERCHLGNCDTKLRPKKPLQVCE